MNIEETLAQASAVVLLYPVFTPLLVLSAITCFAYRRSRWVAPLWVFGACFVLGLIGLLVRVYLAIPSEHSGPDWGFVGMGIMFIYLFSLWEVIPCILLLLAYPRGDAWGKHSVFPCLLAATLSFVGFISFLPKVPSAPDDPMNAAQREQTELLIHTKGSIRLRGDGFPERWNLWAGEPDPIGKFAITFRREPAVLERSGQAATWSAGLEMIGGGIVVAPLDEDVRRAPELGYVPTVAFSQAEQERGVPSRSFYVKTVDGKFGRIQVELDAYSQGATARCSITGDMNPRPGSRNLEPTEEE